MNRQRAKDIALALGITLVACATIFMTIGFYFPDSERSPNNWGSEQKVPPEPEKNVHLEW